MTGPKLQTLVYDIFLEKAAGKRCSECGPDHLIRTSDYILCYSHACMGEPVWPSGKAIGW